MLQAVEDGGVGSDAEGGGRGTRCRDSESNTVPSSEKQWNIPPRKSNEEQGKKQHLNGSKQASNTSSKAQREIANQALQPVTSAQRAAAAFPT
jgi:hypothetical protein